MTTRSGRRGNQTAGPTRPVHVRQDDLERAVRETLSRQVAVPHALATDPAGLAIRRADRIRRRRTVAGLALATVATALLTTGMAQLGEEQGPHRTPTVVLGDPYASPLPEPTAAVTAPVGPDRGGVDLIIGSTLAGADGGRIPLLDVGPAERAQRAPEGGGWLVVGAPTAAGRSLWLVPPRGAAQVLLAGAEQIALSDDGRQVAWREGADLVAAGIVGGQLVATVRAALPAAAEPVRFVGDRVLVRLDPARPGHLVWRPGGEMPAPGAGDTSRHVYGRLPDGRLVAQVSAGTPRRPCLALLDPGLAPVRTACGPSLAADGRGAVSADGRWLVLNGRAEGGDAALLVDLTALASGTLTARPAGPPLAGAVAWQTDQTVVYADAAGGLVRAAVEPVLAGQRATPTPVPGLRTGERLVVVTG
ncbi:hypothetical protein Q3W71_06675 [Micromonospora sp. C28SCA-DRY-2]|uniref:hypothetical protein n=1 Tax=Micromonospora sp. C28SCA-DRY-2 TaxID=3059522 RepID=UPI00267615B8|nr:hypothetical protein [Micromonospora sp. C28SCA-DRY-2]MDO3701363.1 hypothetical protein [Micromonospora sp. C28SCA-DRY-2]